MRRNDPLTAKQVEKLSPHTSYYIIPHNQTNIKQHALILYNTNRRAGAETEADSLQNAFTRVGFDVNKSDWVDTHELQSLIEISIIPTLQRCSLLVIAIMCHGYRGTLSGSDGSELPVNNILHRLTERLPVNLPMVGIDSTSSNTPLCCCHLLSNPILLIYCY